MDLTLDDSQREIVSTAQNLLTRRLPLNAVVATIDTVAWPPDELWQDFAGQGWFTIGLPAEAGGAGLGLPEQMLLVRELGRALAPLSAVATMLAAEVAHRAGNTALTEAFGSGRRIAGFCRADAAGPAEQLGTTFEPQLHQHLLICDERGAAVLGFRDELVVERWDSIDPGVPLARVRIGGAPPEVAAEGAELWGRSLVLGAALLAGIAEVTAERTTEHARQRIQFGKPIGAQQAVKHRCADMAVQADLAFSQVMFAAASCSDSPAEFTFQAMAAFVVGLRAALSNARAAIQLHGGLGFTWESGAHLYLTRVHSIEQCFGSAVAVRRALLREQAPTRRPRHEAMQEQET